MWRNSGSFSWTTKVSCSLDNEMAQRELKTKERTISTELSGKYKRRIRDSLPFTSLSFLSRPLSSYRESIQRKIAKPRFCHSVTRILFTDSSKYRELVYLKNISFHPNSRTKGMASLTVSFFRFLFKSALCLRCSHVTPASLASHFNAVKNSHSYAVLFQSWRGRTRHSVFSGWCNISTRRQISCLFRSILREYNPSSFLIHGFLLYRRILCVKNIYVVEYIYLIMLLIVKILLKEKAKEMTGKILNHLMKQVYFFRVILVKIK